MISRHQHQQVPRVLTCSHLRDLYECPRRFWLRNVSHIRWPSPPKPDGFEERIYNGLEFHQAMYWHFAGLTVDTSVFSEQIRLWLNEWSRHPVHVPPGRHFPELTLSTPLAGERLLARFDLLVLESGAEGRAVILDWKTEERPRSRNCLVDDIQSKLYPFILTEGSPAIPVPGVPTSINPERVEMVYWFVSDPEHPKRLPYSAATHEENRRTFLDLVRRAQTMSPSIEPPLIHDLSLCARCQLATYCGRPAPTRFDPGDESGLGDWLHSPELAQPR